MHFVYSQSYKMGIAFKRPVLLKNVSNLQLPVTGSFNKQSRTLKHSQSIVMDNPLFLSFHSEYPMTIEMTTLDGVETTSMVVRSFSSRFVGMGSITIKNAPIDPILITDIVGEVELTEHTPKGYGSLLQIECMANNFRTEVI